MAYQYGGFWVGLLRGWQPNYAAQPWAMFVTHGFLHAGPLLLVVNMVTLVALGNPIVARIGAWRFGALYALALLGGGFGFALLSNAVQPMVGASGALFGLAGAWIVWSAQDAWTRTALGRARAWCLVQWLVWPVTLLAALNLFGVIAADALLAWETHLAGFFAGAAAAMVLGRVV